MHGQTVCEVCGNEIEWTASRCHFCGTDRAVVLRPKRVARVRVVNLEKGMPTVAEAVARLHSEMKTAQLQGCRLLYLIHGYGSSGKGGAIREEIRRLLPSMLENGRINDFIPGEECNRKSGHWRQLTRSFPVLESFARSNPGATVVVP